MNLLNTPPRMALSLRTLAWLLRYPNAELRAALPELREALRSEAALTSGRRIEIDTLIDRLTRAPGLQSEAEYVDLFDRGRRTALHLFEHIHGDSRERGPAMVDLTQTYERAGLHLKSDELPDHLPVLLEFASTQPPQEAREFLREVAHIVRAIFSALLDRHSPSATGYAAVLAAVLDLAGERAERVTLAEEPSLDETWAEPEVFGGCSTAGQSEAEQPQPIHIVRNARTPSGARAAGSRTNP